MTVKQRKALARLERTNGGIIEVGDASDMGKGWVWVLTPDTREVPVYDDRIRSWYVTPAGRVHA